jgi:hypothetical protein
MTGRSEDVPATLRDPQTWERVAERIGHHPYTYDLSDSSHRLDVVQIVCEALAAEVPDAFESAVQRVAGILQSVLPSMPVEDFKNLCVALVRASDATVGPPWLPRVGQTRAEMEREHADLNGTMDRGDLGP